MCPGRWGARVTAAIFGVLLGGQRSARDPDRRRATHVSSGPARDGLFDRTAPGRCCREPGLPSRDDGLSTVILPELAVRGDAPYGYTGSPSGYGSVPYGYTGTPYGYGSSPYGYSTPTGYPGTPYGYGTLA